jgi:hypothetical protein
MLPSVIGVGGYAFAVVVANDSLSASVPDSDSMRRGEPCAPLPEQRGYNRNNNKEKTGGKMHFHVSHNLARPRDGFSLIMNDATPKQIAAAKLIDSKGSHI